MNRAISKKIVSTSILCVAMLSFLFYLPMTCFGEAVCPISLGVDVSPYQVNIDAGGVAHYVRVLTYTAYSNTAGVNVYINDNEDAVDSGYIKLTRDSVGHLVVKIDLDAFQDASLGADTTHLLKIVVALKKDIDGCSEKEGTGEIFIIGKKGS